MIWYIDGRPVMKGSIPEGTRRMEDFRILINIAMGGTVNQGKLPADGYYDFVISDLDTQWATALLRGAQAEAARQEGMDRLLAKLNAPAAAPAAAAA